MIDLFTTVGILIVIAGILDAILTARTKSQLTVWALDSAQIASGMPLFNRVTDKFLGPRLISFKAMRRSFLFTTISVIVSFLLIAVVSVDDFLRIAAKTFLVEDGSGFAIALFCFFGVLVSDFFSIAQTRFFARTIERLNDWRMSVILMIADVVMSYTIFMAVFSIFRMVAYILIIGMVYRGSASFDSQVVPSVAAAVLQRPNVATAVSALHLERKEDIAEMQALRAISSADVFDDKRNRAIGNLINRAEFGESNSPDALVTVGVELKCGDARTFERYRFDNYSAYSNTDLMFERALSVGEDHTWEAKVPSADIAKALQDEFVKQLAAGGECPVRYLTVHRQFNLRSVLRPLSVTDLYLTALATNMIQTADTVPYKFSDYTQPELIGEVSNFLINAWISKSMGLFGSNADYHAKVVSSYLRHASFDSEQSIYIPLTTYVASAIGPSLVLFVFLGVSLASGLLRLFQRRLKSHVEKDQLERLIVTSLTTIVSVCAIAVWVFLDVIDLAWRAII